MLQIHRAEHAEPLLQALGELLAQPDGDPFAAEVVAVPSRGVERWLAQRLSHTLGAVDGDGVCANVEFPSAGALLDDAVAASDPRFAETVERWTPERAVWPLVEVVDEAVTQSWADVLAVHLSGDPGRRFAVAAKLARLFARYGRARPAMLRAWHEGRDAQGDGTPLPPDLHWQAELWRRLRQTLGTSPAEIVEDACAALRDHPASLPLPPRFSLFGATRLSPVRVRVLEALAQHRDVHLWLHHPSPALWDAVATARPDPGRRRDDPTATVARNPLLGSLSRDIRELQQLLPPAPSTHHPAAEREETVLGRLQRDLAADVEPGAPTIPADSSLTVHACHGPARQVEVAREVVLGLLRDDDELEPRDIVMMCPDVETFAPLVSATFGAAEESGGHPAGRLRVRLADRALRQTNPLLQLLAQLLDLASHRVTATQLLDLAGAAPVRSRFGFSDDDVERLRGWVAAANARWGLDAEHRDTYGLGGLNQGTWRAALDRLLLGAAMEDDGRWVGTTLPLDDVDSGDLDLAGRLAELVDRVDAAVRAFNEPHNAAAWTTLLAGAVFELGEPAQPWQAIQLHGELGDLADAAGDTDLELSRADITVLLQGLLAGRPSRASFRTGTLTVCTLVPMRSVPHRVVVLLGMDDGVFPRHGVVDGDDVLAREPRTGERDVRSEDRQLFLDAICAAQQHLVVTYTGADPRTGAAVPPCVPLGELLDALDATVAAPPGQRGRDQVVVHHPLQPFDPRNFTPTAARPPFSFDPGALAGARAAIGPRAARPPMVAGPLPPAPGADVALEDLVRFVEAPVRAFLRQRLGISTYEDDHDPDDALPISPDGLEKWAIGERVLQRCVAGAAPAEAGRAEHLRGHLPPGVLGDETMRDIGGGVTALLAASQVERETPARSVDVSVRLDDGRLLGGTVTGLRGHTLLEVGYSRLGAKQRLRAWVRLLALVAATNDADLRAVVIGRARHGAARATLAVDDPGAARHLLADLVALRDEGLCEPLPLAAKTSAEYAERRHRGASVADAADGASRKWQDREFGENRDRAHVLAFDGVRPFAHLTAQPGQGPDETTRFGALARRLWTPLLQADAS